MTAREIMTENPACCTPDDTVQHAAKLMVEHDCGCVPVVDDIETRHLVGVGTDRDLACRCLGEGKGRGHLRARSCRPSRAVAPRIRTFALRWQALCAPGTRGLFPYRGTEVNCFPESDRV